MKTALALLLLITQPTYAQTTLGEFLAARNLPQTLPKEQLSRPINGAALSDTIPKTLAWYEGGYRDLPLHILQYDTSTNTYRQTVLPESDNLPADCLGDILSINSQPSLTTIITHVNPTQSCTLILDSKLQLTDVLYPDTALGQIGSLFVVEEDAPHFAPVHPNRLSLYDPVSKHSTPIYPGPDSARQKFTALLRRHLPSKDWCRQHPDGPCDPTEFDTWFDNVIVAPDQRSFTFDVTMSSTGFSDAAERSIPDQTVRYRCTRPATPSGKWTVTLLQPARGSFAPSSRVLSPENNTK